jgi:ribosomal protein S18 acetylase RimI-like enzyme
MEIRPATPGDVPAVLPMVEKVSALHERWDAAKYPFLPGIAGMYDGWLRSLAKNKRGVFLVAEGSGGKIAGFVVGTVEREIPIYRLEEFGFIHDLWVEEEYRHEGIGRQLVMLAVEKFKEMGMKQVRLDTAMKNEEARKLFEGCGFRGSVVEMLMELSTNGD